MPNRRPFESSTRADAPRTIARCPWRWKPSRLRPLAFSGPPNLASDSDFTAEDPLALDYLGQQVGLWLFRGFTTRTSRAQNYAVVLYGLHLAELAIHKNNYSADDETRTRLFERWERFWALATLESRDGELARGDEDAMRGVLGAKRAWFPGSAPLPLDFALISRQNELGGLGAYLSSLREYGLVFPGTLRVTPAARGILDAFWVEPGEKGSSRLYDEYALEALNFENATIPRKRGLLTLAGLGRRSRLSSLVKRSRTDQQRRLWDVLFAGARDDSTLPLAKQLIAAHGEGVDEPEALLEGFLAGRWGELRADVSSKVEVALAFGRMARVLLDRFHRAYGHVAEYGWVSDFEDVADAAFPKEDMTELRAACVAVLEAPGASRFRKLPEHGPAFISLLGKLAAADTTGGLEHLLTFHQRVHRSRRGGGAWLRREQDKLVMQVTSYTGYKSEAVFPDLKLGVVRRGEADVTLASGRVLDRLVAEEPCLGAVFTAYGFDPAFFEDHVLRAVLRLTSDPVEQAARYHGEARRALQETPVVAIVDAGERCPGRRLPFD